jgi:hypothetical protein
MEERAWENENEYTGRCASPGEGFQLATWDLRHRWGVSDDFAGPIGQTFSNSLSISLGGVHQGRIIGGGGTPHRLATCTALPPPAFWRGDPPPPSSTAG